MAESFGADPGRYDRTRPGYPDVLVARVVAAIPGPDVLDVGIGTGIAARQFRAARCRVLGVDPDARMAQFARQSGFEVDVASFETWDPAGRTFDAVISGTTWHWVDPIAGAVKAADVLRSGGRLAVFWNVPQPPLDVAEAFAAVYRRVLPDSFFSRCVMPGVKGYSAFFARAADGIRQTRRFGAAEQWQFDWERTYTREEWLDQVPTSGGHSQLAPAKLDALLAGIGDVIDAASGSFTMRYATVLVTAQLQPPD